MHDVHTVCSQARTDTECVIVAQELETAQSHCIIFVRLKEESVIRSAMSHPCWSLPPLLTSHVPQHAALLGPRDLLQEDIVHPEQLPHEPLPKTSANAIRSESNAKESLSHPNYESAGGLRNKTPTKSVWRSWTRTFSTSYVDPFWETLLMNAQSPEKSMHVRTSMTITTNTKIMTVNFNHVVSEVVFPLLHPDTSFQPSFLWFSIASPELFAVQVATALPQWILVLPRIAGAHRMSYRLAEPSPRNVLQCTPCLPHASRRLALVVGFVVFS